MARQRWLMRLQSSTKKSGMLVSTELNTMLEPNFSRAYRLAKLITQQAALIASIRPQRKIQFRVEVAA